MSTKLILIGLTVIVIIVAETIYRQKHSLGNPFKKADFEQVGKLLYTEHLDEYQTYINSFRSDPDVFMAEHKELIDEYGFDELTEFDAFRLFGEDKGYFIYMDWRGEENVGEVESFIQKRLKSVIIDWSNISKLRSHSETIDQRDGNFILELYKAADADLRNIGYALLFQNIDADGYSFMPVNLETFQKVKSFAPNHFKSAIEIK